MLKYYSAYSALTLSFCIWISEGVSWLDITTVTPVYPFPSIWILLDCKKHCTHPSRHQHRKETVFDITIFLRVCSGKEGSLVKEASLDKKAIKIFLLYFHFVFKRMKGGWKTPWPKARKAERKHWPGKIADLGADCLTSTATENAWRLKWTLKTSLFRNPNI